MLDEIARWLVRPPEADERGDALVAGLAARLLEAGLPARRVSISFRTLHPEVWAQNVTWTRDGGAVVRARPHSQQELPDYRGSPVEAIHRGAGTIRVRLGAATPYPQLADLAAQGMTDYVIHPIVLAGGARTFFSVVTDRAGGFTDDELAALEALVGVLGLRVALVSSQLATRSLLHVYLGANAAHRVIAGAVRRGSGEEIDAAILFCDLRGFTTLSDTRPAAEVVALLDDYFDCVAGPVADARGEVLKFIGDAMLAVFTGDAAAARAVGAVESGISLLAARRPELSAGFAVHAGRVMFGNIGSRERLDFTVIGAAVNEASRVQGLCKDLGVPLLVTDAAVRELGRDDVVALGTHPLRGVREPRALFTLSRFREGLYGPRT